jgi:predicted membrane protein
VPGRVLWGIVLVVVGGVFLLDELGMVAAGDLIATWWPMILVVVGVHGLITSSTRNLGALILLFLGVTFQADALTTFAVWSVAWPLAIVGLGVWLLLRRPAAPSAGTSSEARTDAFALMSERVERVTSREWEGGEVVTIMGSTEVHLEEAELAPGGAEITVTAIMGGTEVFVPDDWHVVVDGTPILGSVEDARREPALVLDEDRPLLRVRGVAILGGIEVRDVRRQREPGRVTEDAG